MALCLPFSTRFCLKTIMPLKASRLKKTLEYFLPTEPPSGRGSQSMSNIYHQHKDLHKMQQWQCRSLKSNVSLCLEGLKSMSPIKAALDMKLPLWRVQQGGTGILKPCSTSHSTTPVFYSSLCLVQKLSHKDPHHPSVFFLSHFLCLTGHRGTVSAGQESQSPSC